jgi:hypothetical protein
MKKMMMIIIRRRRRWGRRAEKSFSSYSYIVSQHNEASEISYAVICRITLHPIMDNLRFYTFAISVIMCLK